MKTIRKILDYTLGKILRHFVFILVKIYYGLFYNVSCSNKHLLQDLPGGLILSSHVSRHDAPLLIATLYSTKRIRPTAHYTEYYNWLQWVPMVLTGAIPMSSPKKWSKTDRLLQKAKTLSVMKRVISNDNFILLFPSGRIRTEPREIIKPYLSGTYETLKAVDCPVVVVRIEGLSKFDEPKYDRFWSFLFINKGRRHVNIDLEIIEEGLSTNGSMEAFNMNLEDKFNQE